MSNSPFTKPVVLPKFIDNGFKQRYLNQKNKALLAEQDPILPPAKQEMVLPEINSIQVSGLTIRKELPVLKSKTISRQSQRINKESMS